MTSEKIILKWITLILEEGKLYIFQMQFYKENL